MRLSIRTKLSLFIFATVLLTLSVNMILNYYSTKSKLIHEMEERMKIITQQVSLTMLQSQYADDIVERLLAEKLNGMAIQAGDKLPPKAADITNNDLRNLSRQIGVSHISVLQYTDKRDDIVVKLSSDPSQLGLSTNKWGFWYTAFQQLFEYRHVFIPQGEKRVHFWSVPFDKSTSKKDHLDKWGYYYDGQRDYMISLNISDDPMLQMFFLTKPNQMVKGTLELQPTVLEVTSFNPKMLEAQRSGIEPEQYNTKRSYYAKTPIKFGTYEYRLEQDNIYVHSAYENREAQFVEGKAAGKTLYKSFIPVHEDGQIYILSVVMDAQPLKETLHNQLLQQVKLGVILLGFLLVSSYLLATTFTRPMKSIMDKVNMLAEGRFDTPLIIKSQDEFRVLADNVSQMGDNLHQSTKQLRSMYEENYTMRKQLQSFINQSTDAIHVSELDGRVKWVNQSFTDMFGWSEAEIADKVVPIIPSDLSEKLCEVEETLQSGRAVSAMETIRLTKDGRLIDVSVSMSPITDEEGNPMALASITRDITSRKRMEELLRRSEKLTTIGQLAAGVAHEVRNPLTTLKGFIQLQKQTGKVNPMHTSMMLSELDRINLIVSEFLVLAKPQALHVQKRELRKVVEEVLSLLNHLSDVGGITFVTRFEEQVPLVGIEENQMKQVFINIIKNAIEAMPDGGNVEVSIDYVEPDRIRVRVQDHGIGIADENLSKLGDPFYTDKENGTGLGLMVSQRIIYNHQGTFDIQSKRNEGTLITITLPVA